MWLMPRDDNKIEILFELQKVLETQYQEAHDEELRYRQHCQYEATWCDNSTPAQYTKLQYC